MPNRLSKLIGIFLPKPHWFWKCLLIIIGYTCAVWWTDDHYFPKKQFLEAHDLMAATSIVIGLLLAFRTNTAYDRWWEGRKLWGQLVNEIRNLSIKLKVCLKADPGQQQKLGQLLVAFPYCLKSHLRGETPDSRIINIAPGAGQAKHLPLHLSDLIYSEIYDLREETGEDGFQLLLIDPHARALMDICGACERILKSPISGSYKFLIWLWLLSYLLVLPWLLVPIVEGWSVLVMLFGTYFVLAIEFLAEEVEDPFGPDPNDLPLDSICQTIETSVCSVTGCMPLESWIEGSN